MTEAGQTFTGTDGKLIVSSEGIAIERDSALAALKRIPAKLIMSYAQIVAVEHHMAATRPGYLSFLPKDSMHSDRLYKIHFDQQSAHQFRRAKATVDRYLAESGGGDTEDASEYSPPSLFDAGVSSNSSLPFRHRI